MNKYGTRLQNGPLEYAYPECRKAVVDRLVDFVNSSDYDGLCLYTYCENFTLRYPDEFGYSQPIVDEFKKRYNVDIRTQAFDKDAWARLRGEYLTSLLVDLKARLASHQKKLVVWLSADDSHLPMTWHSGGDGKTRTAGHIYMDWKEWIRRDAVDELCVYWPGDDDTLAQVLAATKGTPVRVSIFRTHGDLPDGVIRVIGPGGEMESGYPEVAHIGWPDERLASEPVESITRGDTFAKRRALYCVAQGKESAPLQDLIAATNDSDVYVRRRTAPWRNPKIPRPRRQKKLPCAIRKTASSARRLSYLEATETRTRLTRSSTPLAATRHFNLTMWRRYRRSPARTQRYGCHPPSNGRPQFQCQASCAANPGNSPGRRLRLRSRCFDESRNGRF